ncbi:hypothetical protein CMALT394_1200002 [Carnobacterium maltaromaticum]|nr:hypothetical protein CMALT394_1200002 [Carnobacterium maltaromaticum]
MSFQYYKTITICTSTQNKKAPIKISALNVSIYYKSSDLYAYFFDHFLEEPFV